MSRAVTSDGVAVSGIPAGPFALLLFAGVSLATCYGSTFLLADLLEASGRTATAAGPAIAAGALFSLAVGLVAGRLADAFGLGGTCAIAALMMLAAMLAFAGVGHVPGSHYVGGVLLGGAWSLFYMLAPLLVVRATSPGQRVKYLTLLSGSQMLGLGLANPVGSTLVELGSSRASVYVLFGGLAILSALALAGIRGRLGRVSGQGHLAMALSLPACARILRARTALPIAMIGLAACAFSGLATFQDLFASSIGQSARTFFLVFTVVTVVLRFAVAGVITRLPMLELAIGLALLILVALGMLLAPGLGFPGYVAAAGLFAAGYGLIYSVLNSIVVNLAERIGLEVAIASQVFTLVYFLGLFGFPAIASGIIESAGMRPMLATLVLAIVATLALGIALRSMERMPGRRAE